MYTVLLPPRTSNFGDHIVILTQLLFISIYRGLLTIVFGVNCLTTGMFNLLITIMGTIFGRFHTAMGKVDVKIETYGN